MKKFLIWGGIIIIVAFSGFMTFVYFINFSEGERTGELIKFSKKGVLFKTWEGEISQGVSQENHFSFSVLDSNKEVIETLKKITGKVRLSYKEKYRTFAWWGDTRYFIISAKPINNQTKTEDADFDNENKRLKQRIEELEKELYELKYKNK